MSPKIKNIILFGGLALAMVITYLTFFGGDKPADLVTTGSTTESTAPLADGSALGGEFLSLLLNIKTISLNDSIFADPAFENLSDASIILRPDGTEGRPNPFAPLGN